MLGTLLVVGLGLAVLTLQSREMGLTVRELAGTLLERAPMLPYAFALIFAFPIVLRLLKLDNRSRLRRYFEGLTFGITDRRVLVIDGDHVQSFAGEELDRPRVIERAGGYGDVIFGRNPSSGSTSRQRDPVRQERDRVGFKGLPNPEEIRDRLEEWIAGELQESADTVSDFIEAKENDERPTFATPEGMATLRHPATGMTVDYPDQWSVKVRKKKKPLGKTFLDRERWGAPSEIADWNFVRIEGPSGCTVDAEIFETPMLASYESMAHGVLASLAGEVIDSDPDYSQHGMQGFEVTRRSPVRVNQSTGSVGDASVVTPLRHTVLHDGRYQLSLVSRWPERSRELAAAVDLVVRSARLSA
jgi:hypothetical protein